MLSTANSEGRQIPSGSTNERSSKGPRKIKKMPTKGGSSVLITPVYEGRILKGIHEVAGDGLSLISVKVPHRNCKFIPDPDTRQPLISCAQGIKARNSFWNLHRPDLSKVKGLQCSTTESVTQLFQAHNVNNAGKPSYKKKVLRLLGSLVTKKTKTQSQREALINNRSWPVDKCVLSSICQEKEINQPGIVNGSILNDQENKQDTIGNQIKNNMGMMYSSLPSSSNEFSDNALIKNNHPAACFQEAMNFHGNSAVIPVVNGEASSCPTKTTEFKLVRKESLPHISVSKKLEDQDKPSTSNITEESLLELQDDLPNTISLQILQSEEVIQSIFSEMFKEMQDIEDYISSYIGSFCTLEEEFENLPALDKMPSVVSYFWDKVNSQTKLKSQGNSNISNTDEVTHTLNKLHITKKGTVQSLVNIKSSIEKEEISYIFTDEKISADFSNSPSRLTNIPAYCYWEDVDGLDSKIDILASRNDLNMISKNNSNSLLTNNTSLAPVLFFDDIWKNFIKSIALMTGSSEFQKGHSLQLDESKAHYGHWASIFDENITVEVQNIVSSIDNFLVAEVFPYDDDLNYNRMPCTIVEIDETDVNHYFTCNSNPTKKNEQESKGVLHYSHESSLNTQGNTNDAISKEKVEVGRIISLQNNSLKESATRNENSPSCLTEIDELLASLKQNLDELSNQCIQTTSNYTVPLSSTSERPTYTTAQKNLNHSLFDQKVNQEKLQNKSRGVISNLLETDSSQIELGREISQISTNFQQEQKLPFLQLQGSNSGRSRLVRIPETCDNNSSETNSNLVFSSPRVQLNLTNPLTNTNKK